MQYIYINVQITTNKYLIFFFFPKEILNFFLTVTDYDQNDFHA